MSKKKSLISSYELNAVKLFRSSDSAILSTVSAKHEGYPFGRVVTYMSGDCRTAYLYLSDIAQHTKNLNNNSKSCLTIIKIDSDKQNSERLTLLGDLKLVEKNKFEECSSKYYEFFPKSKEYAKMHGFNFYQFEISSCRWIGGFGKIAWLKNEYWNHFEPKWKKNQKAIIEHMNDDHSNSICSSLNAQYGIEDINAKMLFLTIDGYYVLSNEKIYFIQFDITSLNAKQYKDNLVSLAHQNREFEL